MRRCGRISVFSALVLALGHTAFAGDIIDATGRSIKLAEPLTRIAAAGPPAEVLLYALAPDAMIGWVRPLSPRIASYMSPEVRALPAIGGVTAQGEAPEIPDILAAKPQMILDFGDIDPRYTALAAKMQERTGVPYVLLDGALDKTPEILRAVGKLTGRAERGEALAVYAADMLARAKKIAAAHADKPAKAYIARNADGSYTAMPGTHGGDIYDLAGLKNIAQYADTTPVQVQDWDPDVIIALDAKFNDTTKGPAWANVRAVKTGHVIMPPRLPWGWTDHPPSINRLIGVLWLTSAVYGEPSAAGLKDETARFYKMFFHVDLTPSQLADMLETK